jgi:hypothetical protein
MVDMAQCLDQAEPSAEPVDVVDEALAQALAAAATAGRWAVVETLARELEARRLARAERAPAATPDGLIDLDAEKRRRGR